MPKSYQVPDLTEILEVLKWTLKHTNIYFRVLHGCGIWIPRADAERAVPSGWNMCDTQTADVPVLFFGVSP